MKKRFIVHILVIVGFLAASSFAALATPVQVTSKNADLRLYGKIKTDLSLDTAQFGLLSGDIVGPVANRVGNTEWGNDSVLFNPQDTRLGVLANYGNDTMSVKGLIELDFYGNTGAVTHTPRMRHAYAAVTLKSTKTTILMGQTWIPISTLFPSTIVFAGLTCSGDLWDRVPQITLKQTFADDFTLTLSAMGESRAPISIMVTNKDLVPPDFDEAHTVPALETNNRIPWMLGRLAYKFEEDSIKGLFALGGGYVLSNLGNKDNIDPVNRYVGCIEFKLSAGPILFKSEAWIAKGIGPHFTRSMHTNFRVLLPTPEIEATPIDAFGAWADLTYEITSDLTVTAGYGLDDPKDEDLLKNRPVARNFADNEFTKNQTAYINCWYEVLEGLKIGVEFMHVDTERHTSAINHTDSGNRATFSTMYVF